jgi:hypothetical protein
MKETQQTAITDQLVSAMYLASRLFAPSYTNYYQRILSLSPTLCNQIKAFDFICARLALQVEVGDLFFLELTFRRD